MTRLVEVFMQFVLFSCLAKEGKNLCSLYCNLVMIFVNRCSSFMWDASNKEAHDNWKTKRQAYQSRIMFHNFVHVEVAFLGVLIRWLFSPHSASIYMQCEVLKIVRLGTWILILLELWGKIHFSAWTNKVLMIIIIKILWWLKSVYMWSWQCTNTIGTSSGNLIWALGRSKEVSLSLALSTYPKGTSSGKDSHSCLEGERLLFLFRMARSFCL